MADPKGEGPAIAEVLLKLARRNGATSRQAVVAAAAYMLRGALLDLSPDEQARWGPQAIAIAKEGIQ